MGRGRASWLGLSLPYAAAGLVTALAVLAVLAVDDLERQRFDGVLRGEVTTQLNTVRARLEHELNEPLVRTRGVVAFVIARGDITGREFESLASVLMNGPSPDRRIALSRGTVVTYIYPMEGNTAVIGADYRNLPRQWPSVEQAIRTHQPNLNGPVPLVQGGTGLIVRAPIYLPDAKGGDDHLFGVVSVALNIAGVFEKAGLEERDLPFAVAIRGRDGRGAEGEMVWGDEAIFSQSPVQLDVALPYGTWRMAAIPKGGWEQALRPELLLVRLFGGCLIGLVAVATFGLAYHLHQRVRMARQLRAWAGELERSNADLEEFAYVAAHDLQTPLRSIVSFSQLLSQRYRGRLDEDADEFLGFIISGAKHMSALVSDLLSVARIAHHSDPVGPLPAAQAVEDAVQHLAPLITQSGAVVTVGPLPTVRAAEVLLVSLFQNLIENAIQYRHPDRPVQISIAAERAGDLWRFTVKDNAIGIEPEYFDKIFRMFQRLRPTESEGTGAGLAICQRIVRGLGGEIWVESVPGEGSTFSFTLPEG